MTDPIELKEKFLIYYKQLPIQKLAGAHIGRDEDTISRWKREDADFAEKMEAARADFALENLKGVRNKEWALERVLKDHFSERKELTGAGGKPLLSTLDVPDNNSSQKADQAKEED